MPRRKPYDQQALGWVTTHAEHRKWESKRERPIKNSGPGLFSGVDWPALFFWALVVAFVVLVLGPYTTGIAAVLCAAALVWTIVISKDWHKGSGGLLVVSFLTSVAIGMALELGRLLLNHVCCKCCPCHDDEAISDAPAGQRADAAQA